MTLFINNDDVKKLLTMEITLGVSILGKPVPLTPEEIKRAAASTYKPSSIEKTWSYHKIYIRILEF